MFQWVAMAAQAAAAGGAPAFWRVRKGAIVRSGAETSSALVCELDANRLVATAEARTVGGTVRLRVVEPCAGWCSQKVLDPVKGLALGALDARALLEVRTAGRKGDGVFARAPLPAGCFVGERDGRAASAPTPRRRRAAPTAGTRASSSTRPRPTGATPAATTASSTASTTGASASTRRAARTSAAGSTTAAAATT